MYRFRKIGLALLVILSLFLVSARGQNTPGQVVAQSDLLGFGSYQAQEFSSGDIIPVGQAEALLSELGIGVPALQPAKWPSSPFSGPLRNPPIANYGVVEEGVLYRSAQPSAADYAWLVSQGFKSVVSFRKETGDESDRVLDFGFENYLWLNITDESDPSDAQAEQFLDFVTDSQNWPILIHCKVGLGRTGTMAALVRYAIDGWPMQEAIAEARIYRGGVDLVPDQIAWLNRWAPNHPPGSATLGMTASTQAGS